ncbi:MAG: glutathione S-transferase N-terminal domain-containing protein [Gammaproteobacteria bacterium]|nr:glutathione S-transferase N-terminal domain-containing protein [Gammaproteobacteria bacterium]
MASIANRRSVMVLYSDSTSPAGHCVRLVLGEKDINVEINYVEDGERPEALIEINPYNSVLTLIDRDLVLYDEQIIMEYLDERFPHPPLLPVDPVTRAGNRQLRFRVLKDLYSLIDDIESSDSAKSSNAQKNMKDNLTAIAPAFMQKPYFMSDEYTLVDCCMAPLLWRLSKYGVKLPASASPVEQYADRLFERDAFQSSLSEAEKEMRGLVTI